MSGEIKMPCPRQAGPDLKIKRMGAVRSGNSGNGPRRMRTPVKALRDKTGKHLPWPAQGAIIWNPNACNRIP
jgi:hypothetical protein